jgi:hypothetical protein
VPDSSPEDTSRKPTPTASPQQDLSLIKTKR